jgi:hypothetical protein
MTLVGVPADWTTPGPVTCGLQMEMSGRDVACFTSLLSITEAIYSTIGQ